MSGTHKLCTKLNSDKMTSQIYCWFVPHLLRSKLPLNTLKSILQISTRLYTHKAANKETYETLIQLFSQKWNWNMQIA